MESNETFQIKVKAQDKNAVRFQVKQGNQLLSFKNVFELWSKDRAFIQFYAAALIQFDYKAFYWEHPAVRTTLLDKTYECVIKRSKPLEDLPSDETAFGEYLYAKENAVDFMNLGRNARLVVPTKQTEEDIYAHLGKFIRAAEKKQLIEDFQSAGKVMLEELEKGKMIWLNTAGLGVIWLHIRMDTRPKYYKTKAYKEPSFLEDTPLQAIKNRLLKKIKK